MPVGADTGVVVLPSGVALASGISIAERDGPNALNDPTGDVTWNFTANGAIAGWDATYRPDSVGAPDQHLHEIGVRNPSDATPATTTITLEVDNAADFLNRVFVSTRNKNNTKSAAVTVIDANGQSDLVRSHAGISAQSLRLYAGSQVVTMPAIAAGGTTTQLVTDASFGGKTPSFVLAQFTTGGSIFFSNQYVIGTYGYGANNFNFECASGAAFAAGWTIGLYYLAVFINL